MALPTGIATATVSFGKSYSYTGSSTRTDLEIIPKDAFGNKVTLIWAATGERIDAFTEPASAEPGIDGLIVLPITDQAGFLNTNGETITNWYYEATQTAYSGTQSLKQPVKRFQIATGTVTLDLDLIPDGQTVTGSVTAPLATVLSVNGSTGAVNVEPAGLSDTTKTALNATIGAQIATPGTAARVSTDGAIASATKGAAFRAGRKWLFIGTSITNGSNASNIVYAYPAQSLTMVGSWRAAQESVVDGSPGSTVAFNVARLAALLTTHTPDAVFFEVGPNDASTANATALAAYQASIMAAVAMIRSSGRAVVLTTPSPSAGAHTSAEKRRIQQFATWIRLWAASQAIEVADFNAFLLDPATGVGKTAYYSDDLHPNTLAHMQLGQIAAASMLRAINRVSSSPSTANLLPGGLATNPMLVFTATTPTGSSLPYAATGTAPVLSMEATDSTGRRPAGNWAVETLTAAADSVYTRAVPIAAPGASTWAEGDTIAITGYVEITDTSGHWLADVAAGTAHARIYIRNQNNVNLFTAWERSPGIQVASGVFAIGPAFTKFVVPAGTTALQFLYEIKEPNGHSIVARWATLDLINLTALGLA